MSKNIKGISVLNPVDVEREYYLKTVDYAIEHGFDHIQLIGPIHDYVRGNIDGMIFYEKYSRFNDEKDAEYVRMCLDVVNEACAKAKAHGIENYMWHHELYLPGEFMQAYPEVVNAYGDVEVSHPLVQDFLEEKIADFFAAYPSMDGIILTLHETSVPLLKLQNQKLGKIERVKHVTKILFDACQKRGKTLIVRPFASLEEDYEMMTAAYEEISTDLIIMDKWTQFDWSLAMPSNPFFNKIKKNPLCVEADIFGEYFGKGRLPLMLAKHIADKFDYCKDFNTVGYVARIDRNGQHPFGDVNAVNLDIYNAHLDGRDAVQAAQSFFAKKYPDAAKEVMALMEPTEQIVTDIFYINRFLFSQLSIFPDINHSKNHFYFEMMREDYKIASDEWFIPKPWARPALADILSVMQGAETKAAALFETLETLETKIEATEYKKLWVKFLNLKYVTAVWHKLAQSYMQYVRCFEVPAPEEEARFEATLSEMVALAEEGSAKLGTQFYCRIQYNGIADEPGGLAQRLANEMRESYAIEKRTRLALEAENNTDYIVCGGALEGHLLQKEVNFSDVRVHNGKLCRLPGNGKGKKWSAINAHGWFSYELTVVPGKENKILLAMESPEGIVSCRVQIGDDAHEIYCEKAGEQVFEFTCVPESDSVRIRIDRNSPYVPYVYSIRVR